jgi:hypothetical protein
LRCNWGDHHGYLQNWKPTENCFISTCHPCFMVRGGSWALTLVNPWKGETVGVAVLCAGSHQLTRYKFWFNNEPWKTTCKPLLGGSWICYNLSVQVFESFQIQANPCAGLLLKHQTKVISGSGYLKKIQRTGWFPQRTN